MGFCLPRLPQHTRDFFKFIKGIVQIPVQPIAIEIYTFKIAKEAVEHYDGFKEINKM